MIKDEVNWNKLIDLAIERHGKDDAIEKHRQGRLYPLKVLRSDNSLTYYIMLAPEEKGGDAEIYAELRIK